MLMRPIEWEEVEVAVMQMEKGTTLGPDGFTVDFYQFFWDIVKEEVWEIVEESRRTRRILKAFNATFLTLIPKDRGVDSLEKFHPISLCNVILKIITKVIANHLKPLLPFLVSSEQMGFMEGRQILDGIILAHEMIHSLKKSKSPGMLLKVDLAKAYDKVDWDYLEEILTAFGFSHDWVKWIGNLISLAFFSIRVNGSPSDTFHPSRGLRQGDPLSPFLFILLAEGLGRILKAQQRTGELKGLHPHNSQNSQTHQQFVDDTLLMGIASVREARVIKKTLEEFHQANDLDINKGKSQLFLFNTQIEMKRDIIRMLGFTEGHLPSKFLGAPLVEGTPKDRQWKELLDKMESKLRNWTYRALNFPARLTLVKAILQAMPTYLFSVLAAPKVILKCIRAIQWNFLWGSSELKQKWALVDWETVCKPKRTDGLGLRDLETANKVMSAKIWWRWVTHKEEPWAKFWHHKYTQGFLKPLLIRYEGQCTGSPIWWVTNANRGLIQNHSFWEIGNGEEEYFFKDSWQQLPKIQLGDNQDQWQVHLENEGKTRVKDFWVEDNSNSRFRVWKPEEWFTDRMPAKIGKRLYQELQKRKIDSREIPDQLR